ncbi:hypothetical protein [Pseudanabaena sp. SR411]|uniref:hypothetical protein n=1 Tax=Pseudanabaena sp. SR411 TaxID=1980935 RepID=UPI0015959A26|nr:hypothetical protein [Pseudanabaena sp. SR411]
MVNAIAQKSQPPVLAIALFITNLQQPKLKYRILLNLGIIQEIAIASQQKT